MGTFKYLLPGNVKNKQPKHLLLAFCALLKYIQIFCEVVQSGNLYVSILQKFGGSGLLPSGACL